MRAQKALPTVPADHYDQLAHRRIKAGGAVEFYRVYAPNEMIAEPHCYWMVSDYHEDGTHSTLRWVSFGQYQKGLGSQALDWSGFTSPLTDTKEILAWIDRCNPKAIDCWPPKSY